MEYFIFYLFLLALIPFLLGKKKVNTKKQQANYKNESYTLEEIFNIAIAKSYRIKILYETSPLFRENEITERIIQPLEMKYGRDILDNDLIKNSEYGKDKIYIKAFCELRKAERTFRLDRLKILEILKA